MNAYHFTPAEKRITMAGVMIVFLLSALDQTIVSTAMPTIVGQLNGMQFYPWVTTAYLLSSTVMIPIWGKLGDLYGRKPVLLAGISLFLIGSWLAGLAGEFGDMPILGGGMVQLIVFRAIQGLGGGALFTTAFAIIADLYPPRERGKFAGLFGSVFGVSSAIGPLLGGYFTDHGTVTLLNHVVAGWRWVFYLNLPVGLVALFMVTAKMPKLSHKARGKIDYLGALFIIAGCIPLLLALSFGGQQYPWASPQIFGLFGAFVAAVGLFVWAETRAPDPIIHLDLFKNRVFTWANTAGFFSSMAFLSVVAYLPLFMQVGQNVKATTSGLTTLPLMLGLIVSAALSGRLVSKTGRYKPFMIGGMLVMSLGIFLLSQMGHHTSRLDLSWRMLVLGVGLGPLQSLFGLAIQNAVPPGQIGAVTGANQFFRQIGSTIGVALFGALLNHNLAQKGVDLSKLRSMAMQQPTHTVVQIPDVLRFLIADSITQVILLGLIVAGISFLATLMVPELPMRDMAAIAKQMAAEGDPPPDAHL